MAVSATLYGNVYAKAFNGEINYLTDTIKAMLTTSTYVPDQNAHVYLSSVTNEVVGTGYTAGGLTLTSKTVAYASKATAFDCADLVWSSASFTARRVVFYKSTGTASTSPLIGWDDFGADLSPSGGNFTVTIDASGLFVLSVA